MKMTKIKLPTVTLLGVDGVDIERLIVAAEICKEHFEFAAVKLLSPLNSPNSKDLIKIHELPTIESYSEFMIKELDQYVDTEHVLIIQYDGFILNPQAWTNDFLKYDYIGAPWMVKEWSAKFGIPEEFLGHLLVGNGGFCLRSKKLTALCAKLANENVFKRYHPEDIEICVHNKHLLEKQGIVFAPIAVAKQFAFEAETDTHTKWEGQFGFHGFRWTDISNWTKDHPEYDFSRFMH